MRTLLIQAYLGRKEPPVAPLGLASLAGNLHNSETKIVDPNISDNPLNYTKESIEDFKPDLYGFSIRNADTTKFSDQFNYIKGFDVFFNSLKKFIPESVIVIVGGAGFSLYPLQIMRIFPEIDFGFLYEAENSLSSFVQNPDGFKEYPGIIYRSNGDLKITHNPEPVDINNLNPPAWNLIEIEKYLEFTDRASIGIEAKRGCAMNCTYCTYPELGFNSLRLKSPQKVVDEIKRMKNERRIDKVFFTDPVFNFPSEHALEICQKLIEEKVDIKWSAYQSDRYIDKKYLESARESGCDDFYFSPDSASTKGLRILRKSTTVNTLNETLNLIVDDKTAKASFNMFAVIPGTGWKNFLAGGKFLLKAKIKLGRRLTRFKFSYIRLEPETEILQKTSFDFQKNSSDSLFPGMKNNLNDKFFYKSDSFIFNIILKLHFHLGKLMGRKNVLKIK